MTSLRVRRSQPATNPLNPLSTFQPVALLPAAAFETAAFTSTSAIFSIVLTLFTLSALYQGLQNLQLSSSKQVSLRNQTFFCLLLPIVIVYYTKLALNEYVKSLYYKYYEEEVRHEALLNANNNESSGIQTNDTLLNNQAAAVEGDKSD